MKYKNFSDFEPNKPAKVGVLITNLGTPAAPTKAELKKYLKQFLSDPRIVEAPRLLWWLVLNGVILNFRPARSAKAYQGVWTEQGSPLLVHTQAQQQKIAEKLNMDFGDKVVVEYAMRYGEPSVTATLDKLFEQGARQLLVLPLYPQYSATTTASTFDAIAQDFTQRRLLPDFKFISHYHDNPAYIQALADKVRAHWAQHGRADKLIFSYHGIPKRYVTNGDPYQAECYQTSALVADNLGLAENEFLTTFQSRFGREEWLKPYTDQTLKALPAKGVKSVQVICPGFSADCIETIEEIDEENREYFIEAGGETFEYIPALNADAQHIEMLVGLIKDNLKAWIN
ncbi:ferrochelatase [Catenovulum sp. 2E275]|uniref:ferrochelatase n=1 Tax=Catenovulum sp. 2E275 TaxID=2980497 RepID=UPI0021CF6B7E|nr:ferrochelatase [Catenovulum sp. 2E275]MCU4676236.1 ferrochelatase [Catenovulum sp. 2E275]